MTNWQMIHPELQLRHEQPLKEMSLKIGREMFTPRRKWLNLFSNRGTNCLNEYFFFKMEEQGHLKITKHWLEK